MRKEYDFSKSRKNPYAKQLRHQIIIRLDTVAEDYFKQMKKLKEDNLLISDNVDLDMTEWEW